MILASELMGADAVLIEVVAMFAALLVEWVAY